MSDLISRQAAIDAIEKYLDKFDCIDANFLDGLKTTKKILNDLPSAQPERKKGKWILHENQRQEDVDNGNYLYFCSECGRSDIHAKTQEVPFCWWCGSEMREEQYD